MVVQVIVRISMAIIMNMVAMTDIVKINRL